MKIKTLRGDITQVDVDAVVNPADGMQGPRRRIEDKLVEHAGSEVEEETAARGPLHVGEAMLTTGGNLQCRYVIHAPIGESAQAQDAEGVRKSTTAALRCAAVSQLRSLAIPAFPRGANATRALVSALLDFSRDGSFVYTPTAGFAGSDTFTYCVQDGLDSSAVATVTINVLDASDAKL